MKPLDLFKTRGIHCASVDIHGYVYHHYDEGTKYLIDCYDGNTLWDVIKIEDKYYVIYSSTEYMIFDDKDAAIAAMVLEASKETLLTQRE